MNKRKNGTNLELNRLFIIKAEIHCLQVNHGAKKDLEKVEQLVELGFKVSVTGGLSPEILPLFKDLPIYSFIVGRGITASKNHF